MATRTLLPSPALDSWRLGDPLGGSLEQRYNEFARGEIDDSDKRGALAAEIHVSEGWGKEYKIVQLPFEVLDEILTYLLLDTPPSNSFAPRNEDLLACLLTCRALHAATLNVLYRNVTIPHSRIFSKMLAQLSRFSSLGGLVRRLDLSHYTVIGLGRTRRANTEIQNLTGNTLYRCLNLTPNLREFLVHEHIDDVLDEKVLRALLALPSLQAIDLCACSSQDFVRAFDAAVTASRNLPTILPNLRRLSLHECSTLQGPAFERLLVRLPNLTHLEVAHTLITNKALLSIPDTARLTHINLSKCTKLSGEVVVDFLLHHPAARQLQYLNLMSDRARHQLLDSGDLDTLLPKLPSTLKSLNVNGANLASKHLPLLLSLRGHLEELSVAGSALTFDDLNDLFCPAIARISENADHTLDPPVSSLVYVDLTAIQNFTRSAIFDPSNIMLTEFSMPLSVIEISDDSLVSTLRARYSTPGNSLGWIVKESGRRAWLVRDETAPSHSDHGDMTQTLDTVDDGWRPWKWGARWWGMRKIPVAKQEVGGMYGHYMFKA